MFWVYDASEDGEMALDGEMAFADFGIENLIGLIKMRKDDPTILARPTT